jgi:leucyl aminopeptidase
MHPALTTDPAGSRPLHLATVDGWEGWLGSAPEASRAWLAASGFRPRAGAAALLPDGDGGLAGAVGVLGEPSDLWDAAAIAQALPSGAWRLVDIPPIGIDAWVTGWALAAYRYDAFKREEKPAPAGLVIDPAWSRACADAEALVAAIGLARDLINTPASDLGPAELAEAIMREAHDHAAEVTVITGDALLEQGYPAIHAVGRASARPPRLIDLRWGEPGHPKLTLVGKGVCFDTGGLDLKTSAGMLLMKKDMAGAAVMLALARLVMAAGLAVRLRLLVPAVENSVAGNAFRPGDVLRTRKGLTVEIGNTDAEGRLILADALTCADAETPALLLDAATLTGAARTALGPELPALFTPDDALAADLLNAAALVRDPLWRLPLHRGYRSLLNSSIADINNAGQSPFAGAVTAALFLQEFVTGTRAWAHLDIYGWNGEGRPGRPKGGEATALRALWRLLTDRFGR